MKMRLIFIFLLIIYLSCNNKEVSNNSIKNILFNPPTSSSLASNEIMIYTKQICFSKSNLDSCLYQKIEIVFDRSQLIISRYWENNTDTILLKSKDINELKRNIIEVMGDKKSETFQSKSNGRDGGYVCFIYVNQKDTVINRYFWIDTYKDNVFKLDSILNQIN